MPEFTGSFRFFGRLDRAKMRISASVALAVTRSQSLGLSLPVSSLLYFRPIARRLRVLAHIANRTIVTCHTGACSSNICEQTPVTCNARRKHRIPGQVLPRHQYDGWHCESLRLITDKKCTRRVVRGICAQPTYLCMTPFGFVLSAWLFARQGYGPIEGYSSVCIGRTSRI